MKKLVLSFIILFSVTMFTELNAQNAQYENTVVKQPNFRVINVTKDSERTNGVIYFNNSNNSSTYEYGKRKYPQNNDSIKHYNVTKSNDDVIMNNVKSNFTSVYSNMLLLLFIIICSYFCLSRYVKD